MELITIGTSGYSYQDWIGPFYPENMDKKDMLSYYAQHFTFTEINSTYYQMPNRFAVAQWDQKTPVDFQFIIKAHSSMTHTRDAEKKNYDGFMEALQPIKEKDKLSCLLFQFPYSFHFGKKEMDYLRSIRDSLPYEKVCIEYRNEAWINQASFDLMKELKYGFVCVDEPKLRGLIKPVVVATSDLGYVRFHGRNETKWYHHQESHERYDYLYSERELQEWVPRIKTLKKYVKRLNITFNNHFRAQAVINVRMLQRLLSEG